LRIACLLSAAGCVVALWGCAVGPDFKPPRPSMPADWTGPASRPATGPATQVVAEIAQWWTAFNDPQLSSLVLRAAQCNLNIKQAQARVMQARAARNIALGALGPSVNLNAGYSRQQPAGLGSRPPTPQDFYRAGVDASWEIDVFGGLRRNVEAVEADMQANIEFQRNVLVTITAEVAMNYVDLRAAQKRIEIARRNLQAQRNSLELTRVRFEGGLVGGLDVANAEAQAATTAAQIPQFEAAAARFSYAIAVLVGAPPGALSAELAQPAPIPQSSPLVPIGVPCDLLLRRPDIRQAVARIHGATARIGVAEADFFPRFTLTGGLNFTSNRLDDWLSWSSRSWSFGPAATWNIFASGQTFWQVALQQGVREETLYAYQQTLLTAMQEVENAMIDSNRERIRRDALAEAVAANQRAVDLSVQLYTEGQTDFLNVLNAQRSLLLTEDALSLSDQAIAEDVIALYKALGGGWETLCGPCSQCSTWPLAGTPRPLAAADGPTAAAD
jgi:NodT family efflux transporter outer membrane factor (OMF) lipoprotein